MASRPVANRWIRTGFVAVCAAAALLLAPELLLRSGLRINGSPSMPLGLYWLHSGAFPVRRGEIVFACPSDRATAYLRRWDADDAVGGSCPGNMKPLVKIAAALPGDRVALSAKGIRVNDGPLLRASAPQLQTTVHGVTHNVPGIAFGEYTVPADEVWLYAPEWYSFDSRYYGPSPIIGVGKPVWVRPVLIQDHPTTPVAPQ